MNNPFKDFIDGAGSVLILLPLKPYFDQVAAGLSLFLALKGEKEVSIFCPNQMLVEFNRLVGVDKITTELGNRNLVIRFSGYKANDIERVSYDIEDQEFKLTVIPKPGIRPPMKNQVALSYSGVLSDTVIMIGGSNESHFPSLSSRELTGVRLAHIGIKEVNLSPSREVISFARPVSSVSELMGSLIKESGWNLDPDIATNLLLGIERGSNNYSSTGVTADTFQLVADLIRAGGKRERLEEQKKYPPGSIPGQVHPGIVKGSLKGQPSEERSSEKAPKDWMGPKIYKGTSIS